jgi:hypothetical protein
MPSHPSIDRLRQLALVTAIASTGGCRDDANADGDDGDSGVPSTSGDLTTGITSGPDIECLPGEVRCGGLEAVERCAPTGKAWIPELCPSMTSCVPCESDDCTEARCLGPCESTDDVPSSAGCSFIANRQLHLHQDFNDGLVVANPNEDVDATVTLYITPEGKNVEEPVETIVLAPLASHSFSLETNFIQTNTSMYRTGGTHRVQSDIPIIAYHHAPEAFARGNDSSLLLPESALRNEYVIPSYKPVFNEGGTNGQPTYFEVVALQNFTTLEWFPRADTAGNGLPVPFVPAGGRGELKMNRFDTVRIAASGNQNQIVENRDISGTIVKADKPIWVTSGSRCSRVPYRDTDTYPKGHCDPLQEMPIPLEYWGSKYVAAHSPVRETESHWWRVYAATPGVTVTADPPTLEGTPFTLGERGEYVDLEAKTGESFVLESDNGAFMPVQYLQSQRWASDPDGDGPGQPEPEFEFTNIGDPSMYQMVPVEQFLTRYVFVTALNFPINYVQVIREAGAADVILDGEVIDAADFDAVAGYEVADVLIEEGAHVIDSDEPFGIIQVGYSLNVIDENCRLEDEYIDPVTGDYTLECLSSYAYPGGMKSDPIFIP